MWRQFGERIRVLRRQLRLTQARLATMAHVSVTSLGRIERGDVTRIPVGTLDRVAAALGASLRLSIAWRGEALDRLTDAAHAELQNAVAELLRTAGWLVAVEVSFNHYGDRGRCDVLAFHPPTGILVVVEVKTAIGDVQELLGRLDTKVRLAGVLAVSQGWPRPAAVVPVLVVADERQQYRVVADHAALFARFELRGRTARAWLANPKPSSGLLVRLPLTNSRLVAVRAASRGSRVRIYRDNGDEGTA
jgi:transcriptional regulator with XRE-family HTH domain